MEEDTTSNYKSRVSIMKSSLSREQIENLENKHRVDLKGPGTYNPRFLFGKKQQAGITIPREPRKFMQVMP